MLRFPAAAWLSHVPGPDEIGAMKVHLLVMASLGSMIKLPRRQMYMLESKFCHDLAD